MISFESHHAGMFFPMRMQGMSHELADGLKQGMNMLIMTFFPLIM